MLGEGVRAGFRRMGIKYRTVVHVEREAYPSGILAARMAEESLDDAPIWSNVCTFNARAWSGKVDCIVAGFPCQDLSVAGKRVGLDGKRSGLFFEVVRIATDSGAWGIVLENVAGIASATASVVDETEGELDERAAARVVGELADLGWDAEWITLSASDVGASHGRARWFCFAWRFVANTQSERGRLGQRHEFAWRTETQGAGKQFGDTGLQHIDLQQRQDGTEYPRASSAMADHKSFGNGSRSVSIRGESEQSFTPKNERHLADTTCIGRWAQGHEAQQPSGFDRRNGILADTSSAGSEWRGGG